MKLEPEGPKVTLFVGWVAGLILLIEQAVGASKPRPGGFDSTSLHSTDGLPIQPIEYGPPVERGPAAGIEIVP